MIDDWKCSKCGKVPKVMHDSVQRICLACYEASEPGPPPAYSSGDRVTTPEGEGSVVYQHIAGDDSGLINDRTCSVCVKLDAARHYPHHKGKLFLAELVKPVQAGSKRRR